MNIVLDTNVIYGDWYLTGPQFSLLRNYLGLSDARLFVPEIVVLETKNLFKRELGRLVLDVAKLDRYLPDEDILEKLPHLLDAGHDYDSKLDKRLGELNAERPDHSDISHDGIVERALGPRKPFREDDKGYRDCLLWEVVLHKIARKDTITFLISENHRDFADKPTDRILHADLRQDLVSAGLPEDCVQYYSNLKNFIDERVKGELKIKTDDIVLSLKQGRYGAFSVEKWFVENRNGIMDKVNDKIESVFVHAYANELEDPKVTYIEDPEEIEIVEVDHYEGDEPLYHIEVCVTADMAVDVFVTKADYYGGLHELIPLEVWDSDWNKWYIWAVIQVKLPISISLLFDASKEEVESIEVDSIGELWGWCRFCGAQVMSDAAEECWNCGKAFG